MSFSEVSYVSELRNEAGGCMSSPAQGLPGGVGVAFDAGEPVPMVTVRSLLLCC